MLRRRAIAASALAALSLATVYVGVLGVTNSLEHAFEDLRRLWFWVIPLVLGFARQVGLFVYIWGATRGTSGATARGVVASGATSTLSMLACCAHHLTDILPLVGLAGATVFLATYQNLFLLLGLLSNVVGFVYLLGAVKKHGLFPSRSSLWARSLRSPVERALPIVVVVCGTLFALGAIITWL